MLTDEPETDTDDACCDYTAAQQEDKGEDLRERPWEGSWPPPAGDETGYQYGVRPGKIITIAGN